jgi:hypothetical protein
MSIFLIDPLKQSINQPKTGYDIHAVGGAPTNTINSMSTLIYNNKIIHDNNIEILNTYNFQPNSVTTTLEFNVVPDRILNTYYPLYNNSKIVTITNFTSAIRNNRYNFYKNSFDSGYPTNNSYVLCEKLSLLWNNSGFNFKDKFTTDDTGYPYKTESVTINGYNDINCLIYPEPSSNCNKYCGPGSIIDPESCRCVFPPECISQPEVCIPVTIPAIKDIIYGYIFYVDSLRSVYVPEIGFNNTTCGGGHKCCRTLFTPRLFICDDISVTADRSVNLNNIEGCGESNIPPVGWSPLTSNERADTFSFTIPNINTIALNNVRLSLDCDYDSCHEGVSMVFLVAHDDATDEPMIIFASCLTPGEVNSKLLGTVDCNTNILDAIHCSPNPSLEPPCTPPPPSPPPSPSCDIDPISCSSGYLDETNCQCYPSPPPFPSSPPCSPQPVCTSLIEGYAFYRNESGLVTIPGIGDREVRCWGGHCCDRTDFLPELYFPNTDTIIYADNYISMNNLSDCGDRCNSFIFRLPENCDALCTDIPRFTLNPYNNPDPHYGVTFVILVITDGDTGLKRIIYEGCVFAGTPVEVSGRTCWPLPSCNINLSDIDNTQVLHDPPISSPSIDVEAPCCPSGLPVFYFNGEFTSGSEGDATDWSNIYNWYGAEYPATLTVDSAKTGGGTRLSSLSPSSSLRSSFTNGNFCAVVLSDVNTQGSVSSPECATLTVINSKFNINMKVSKGLANFYCSIFGDSDHTNIELQMSRADGGWAFVNHSPAPDCLYIPCTDSYLVTDNIIGEAVVNFYNNSNFSGQIIEDPTYPPVNLNINMCMPSVSPCPLGEPSPQASVSPEIYCPSPSPSPCENAANFIFTGNPLYLPDPSASPAPSVSPEVLLTGQGTYSDPFILDIQTDTTKNVQFTATSSGMLYVTYSINTLSPNDFTITNTSPYATLALLTGNESNSIAIPVFSSGGINLTYNLNTPLETGFDTGHFEFYFCNVMTSPSPSPLCDDFGIGEGLMFNSATDATTSGTGKASDPVIVDITGNNTASFSGYAVYNVLSSGVVVIDYSVSSEVNDKASIYYNFALVEEIGGTTSSTRVISVNYGDIISLRYEKDGSVDGGTDSAHFEMTFCVT